MNVENSTKSTFRVVSVLNSFSPEEPELSAAEISRKAEIPMTTTYRILMGLSKGQLIERNPDSGKYRIGSDLYFLGNLYLSAQDILKVADPVVKTLNDLTNESVSLSVFDKGNVVVVLREESKHSFRFADSIGTIRPAYATAVGKAFLSELTEAEIDSLYPTENLRSLTNKTIRTRTELKQELVKVTETGVAFSNEESVEAIIAIADVVRGANKAAKAALSIEIPTFRIHRFGIDQLVALVKKGASLISHQLGYQDRHKLVRDIQEIRSWWEKSSSQV